MKTKVKELLKEAYNSNDVCQEWKDKIKEAAPKLFPENVLEVGKWYKSDLNRILCCTKNSGDTFSAYGIEPNGDWIKDQSDWITSYFIPATDKEVEDALIKEAKKRGFKEGVETDCLLGWGGAITSKIKYTFGELRVDVSGEARNTSGWSTIFYEGKWATIIETKKEMTVAEVEKELGYEIKIIK